MRRSLGSIVLTILLATPAVAQVPPTYITSWGSAGTGPGQFQPLFYVATDAVGQVYVFDTGRVQIFSSDGLFLSQWATQDPSSSPVGIAVDGLGRVHLLLSPSYRITNHEVYTAGGTLVGSYGGTYGVGCECSLHANGIAAGSSGESFMTRWGYYQPYGQPQTPVAEVVRSLYPSGGASWGSPGSGPGRLTEPNGVGVDAAGFVYVTDNRTVRVQKYTSDGTFITQWGSSGPGGSLAYNSWQIAVGPDGRASTFTLGASQIQEFTSDGAFLGRWGSPGTGPGQFSFIYGIAVDGQGNIFVADDGNYRIQKFGSAPTPTARSSWGRLKSIYR